MAHVHGRFPFFRLDQSVPFDLGDEDFWFATSVFEKIFDEYHPDRRDNFLFIQAYTQLLLVLTRRYFNNIDGEQAINRVNRTADVLLVSRFQQLIQATLLREPTDARLRQPSFYAQMLATHPNHLNAVVKRLTGHTATALIHNQLVIAAKSLLVQTDLSAKEIAFKLHFSKPTHFNSFFRKATNLTPRQYRQQSMR